MAIFQAGNTSRTTRQLRSGGPGAGSNFQDMLSQVRALQRPWQPLTFCKVPPQSRSAEPVFKTIHTLDDDADGAASSQHSMEPPQGQRKLVSVIRRRVFQLLE